MQNVKIYFSHGLESGPNATKVRALMAVAEDYGVGNLEALDYRGIQDPGQRLEMLNHRISLDQLDGKDIILVGSSMGSWVSGKLTEKKAVLGCFLLAPAFALPDYPESNPLLQADEVEIIHGWRDEVVPVNPIIEFCQKQRLLLTLVDDEHRLQDSLPMICHHFKYFLERCEQRTVA